MDKKEKQYEENLSKPVDIHGSCQTEESTSIGADSGTDTGSDSDKPNLDSYEDKSEAFGIAAGEADLTDSPASSPTENSDFDAAPCEAYSASNSADDDSDFDATPQTHDRQTLMAEGAAAGVTPSDGIELLVQMAKLGEIDAKAVDIIDVTDKFLKAIAAAPKESLRQGGRILFHACVLLRMKAESLLSEEIEEDPIGDDFMDFDEDGMPIDFDPNAPREPRQITIADLEKALVRKSQRRKVRKRQVTLEELIEALREAEKIEKSRADKKPKERISMAGYMQVNDVADILDLAHDEDIESTIDRVEQILAEILKIGEKLELFSLVTLLEQNSDWVDAFLASLFLSNAGKIDLEQEEFYGPLYLTLCKQKAVSDTVVSS